MVILAKEKFNWSNTGVYIKKNYRKVIEYTRSSLILSVIVREQKVIL